MIYNRSAFSNAAVGALAIAYAIFTGPALATENGSEHYPLGVNSAQPALLPAPGESEFYNYSAYITGLKFNDNSGHYSIPDFHLSIFADAPRVVHTWLPTWGNWNISSGFAINLTDVRLRAGGESFNRFAIGDPDVSPIYLTYNTPTFHFLLGTNFWVPIGDYNVSNPASAGLNYWTGAPEFAVTWFPGNGWEISADTFTQFSTRNNKTQYHSGNDTDLDYVIGWRPAAISQKLQIGIVGYLYKQWSNDSSDGVAIKNFKGQVYSVGPQIRYDFIHRGGIIIKWQHEVDVRNRPEGNRMWIEFARPI